MYRYADVFLDLLRSPDAPGVPVPGVPAMVDAACELIERAMAYGALVADALYLYTSGSTGRYERLGWCAHDTGHYAGRPIAILCHSVRKKAL